MRISLDSAKCAGHARCHAVDEKLFPIDELGYSILESRDVAATDEALAREGVAACPERALVMGDE